jgi:hypothetical protein
MRQVLTKRQLPASRPVQALRHFDFSVVVPTISAREETQ